jgi:hypothetical protein
VRIAAGDSHPNFGRESKAIEAIAGLILHAVPNYPSGPEICYSDLHLGMAQHDYYWEFDLPSDLALAIRIALPIQILTHHLQFPAMGQLIRDKAPLGHSSTDKEMPVPPNYHAKGRPGRPVVQMGALPDYYLQSQ